MVIHIENGFRSSLVTIATQKLTEDLEDNYEIATLHIRHCSLCELEK